MRGSDACAHTSYTFMIAGLCVLTVTACLSIYYTALKTDVHKKIVQSSTSFVCDAMVIIY